MRRNETLLFFSILCALLAGLLYAWGEPAWFGLFPYASGLRFLLALQTYFLCCASFFSLRRLRVPGETAPSRPEPFVAPFCVSFAPVPAFSLLVLLNVPLQTLHTAAVSLDIVLWAALGALALRASALDAAVFSGLYLLSALISLTLPVPSVAVILVRFLILVAFTIGTLQAIQAERLPPTDTPARDPGSLRETAERFDLSPRETEVLALLAAGRTNAEIAGILFISLSTVKTHISSIFAKTGARNRLEASALCRK